jgi:hypothetical protein
MTRRHISLPTSLVAVGLLSCTASSTVVALGTYDGSFTCDSGPLSLHLPATYPELLALGKIKQIADGQVKDYGTYKVTYRGIEFDGLSIIAYVFSNDPNRYLLARVEISDPSWNIAQIKVGQSAKSTLKHEGWSPPADEGVWELDGDTAILSVSIKNGRIVKLTYSCDAE